MPEKVVYILGAGFSAPLGLPVMSNFLVKSKDLYFSDTDKYKHFKSVFDEINELSISKNYYSADLFNIEEILSIIEMGIFLEGDKLKKVFIDYILDVIKYYTSKIQPLSHSTPANWPNVMFGSGPDDLNKYFGCFVANLIGTKFKVTTKEQTKAMTMQSERVRMLESERISSRSTQYAVITLNYDLVLENLCSFINERSVSMEEMKFNSQEFTSDWENYPPLAKLHGSVDTGTIVPPTWAKGNNPKIIPIWQHAYQILREANHIRIIGYSLPIADSYIKFLLKSAVVKTEHLKTIDVLCMDDINDSVRKRYDAFMEFNNYRFKNASITYYLKTLADRYKGTPLSDYTLIMDDLEVVHNNFFS